MNKYQWSQQGYTRQYWKQVPVDKNVTGTNLVNLNKFVKGAMYLPEFICFSIK